MSGDPLLSIRDLTVSFDAEGGRSRWGETPYTPRPGRLLAVDHVSIDVPRGRTVAVVGESGCGKSVTAQAILRLLPTPPASIDSGEILLEGRDLLKLGAREMEAVRGGRIGMVFQEPMTSLNPVYTVGFHIAEAIRLHRDVSRREARRMAIEGLARVGFPEPSRHIDSYAHELSGGMRQRVLIAIALACAPSLLIADEPTTALDATVQAQILSLLRDLREEMGMSMLLIAHDLALVAEVADEIVVLYAGVVVEKGPARELLTSPKHPYTRALLDSVPPRVHRVRGERGRRLPTIEGALPDLRSPPLGCRFEPRCRDAFDRCKTERPMLTQRRDQPGEIRCFLAETGAAGDIGDVGQGARAS